MNSLSLNFGIGRRAPTKVQMAALVEYAKLLESLGIERIARGVNVTLLPASKEELRETIALVSLSPWTSVALMPSDLLNAYGLLAYFFTAEEIATINRARVLDELIQQGNSVSQEERRIYQEGLQLIAKADEQLASARRDLEAQAGSLKRTQYTELWTPVGNAAAHDLDGNTHRRQGVAPTALELVWWVLKGIGYGLAAVIILIGIGRYVAGQ